MQSTIPTSERTVVPSYFCKTLCTVGRCPKNGKMVTSKAGSDFGKTQNQPGRVEMYQGKVYDACGT
jgi:hypothetical protein